jgi:DNA-binding NarL/FixJ family response regulator
MVRIGIIERNYLLSKNYSDFFEALSDYFIAFQVPSLKDLILQSQQLQSIDVVIIDVPSTDRDEMDSIKYLKKEWPDTKLILFTSRTENAFILDCLKNGADSYLLKTEGLFELHKAIKETMHDGLVISPAIARQLVRHLFSGNHSLIPLNFTVKEKEIIQLVKEGLSYKEMAEQLKVTPFTVNHHLKKIYKKAGVNSRSQLMVLLQKHADSRTILTT